MLRRMTCLALALTLVWGLMAATAHGEDTGDTQVHEAVEWVLAVAQEELGYTESKGGFSKYGEWAGKAYAEWCSEFLSWCVAQVDERQGTTLLDVLYPMQAACITGVNWYTDHGRYLTVKGEIQGWGEQWYLTDGVPVAQRPYVPQRGDLIFIEWYQYNRIDHVGIVEEIQIGEDGQINIITIEGNNPEAVERHTYLLGDATIRAYGTITPVAGTALRRGVKGLQVERLQQHLAEQGLFGQGDIDGDYGTSTQQAVKAFQTQQGLEATGIADKDTQKALGMW